MNGTVRGAFVAALAGKNERVVQLPHPRITFLAQNFNGRAALTRLVGKNVVINPGFVPMLTLEPTDVAAYLMTPGESSAGPTQ